METAALLQKYNVAAPRYTSYPTVPYWDPTTFSPEKWISAVQKIYTDHEEDGISLYIHLPYCESLCTYCGCNTRITKNHAVELPYINAILAEWKMYQNLLGSTPNIKELHLGGGTPTFFKPDNLKILIEGILSGVEVSPDATFSFEAHPANTTEAHLRTLHHLGFKRLSLGIQDFDPKVQMMINRFQTPQQVTTIMRQARAIGFDSINFDLIYGLPAQNISGLSETIEAVIEMKPDRIAFYSYAHVPWLKPGQRHYTVEDLPAGSEKFALYQMGKKMLMEAGYEDVGMDHFALETDTLFTASAEKKLHRNFMGYTDHHTHLLIGLGVSSISDSWNAFGQNPKSVETYLDKINAGLLPVEKGHLLSEEDLEIRQHILNIMCRENTSYPEEIPEAVVKRLSPLIKDQLIQVCGKEINITQTGKLFLRNVCMAFDEKLWAKQPETKLFSAAI